MDHRFQDQQYRLSDFQQEVAVICPVCTKKATAKADYEAQTVRLICTHCGHHREVSNCLTTFGIRAHYRTAAHVYLDLPLWYETSFKNEVFWAYNEAHLLYLEQYIGAKLREHKDRTYFTVLEKLPKFYHDSKNRDALLKIISKLKNKK
ncbi:MAG: hypothetical protein K0M56_04730 [Kaistella sp.]|nr:hypothetical protein [Kaistella sp.]